MRSPRNLLVFNFAVSFISGTPHAVLLAKGKLYRTNSWEDIDDFAMSEYEILSSEEIPPLPSGLDSLMTNPNTKMALIGVAGSVILLLIVVGARMSQHPPETKKKN